MSSTEAMTAGAVLKILARSNPQGGRGDLAWIGSLAGMLDEMLQGYALVQAIDNADQLSGLPAGTELYSSDKRCLLVKEARTGAWSSSNEGYANPYIEEQVIEKFGGLFTVNVPQPE